MLKNLIVYRIAPGWQADLSALEAALAQTPFAECSATQERSAGWVPARGQAHGALAESVAGQWMLRWQSETKLLPASVLTRKVKEKTQRIERETGRKPGKKEMRELKDEAKLDLLPMAFTKQGGSWVWIDREAHTLAVDAGSQSRADEITSALVQALPGLALALIDTQTSPQAAMAHWLKEQQAPEGFAIERECELKSSAEDKAVVRYARHPLEIDEVRAHIDAGKLPTRLALNWDGRVSFVLTEGLQLKKITLPEAENPGQEGEEGGFDADVALATGELSRLIADLVQALGGEGRSSQLAPAGTAGTASAADPGVGAEADAPF